MSENPGQPETESIHPDSDPRRVAQRFAEREREAQPAQIGPYRVLQTLGEGGMGVVYLAEQEKPIHRRVALKIIKLGMDTKQVVARFDTEREALALMNHPNVAKVFDAGVTEQGRPYFAMEYVPGIPITEYCNKQRLTTKERLNLFMDVCHAVQHAHQKGIIHRDIKPGNVLVSVTQDPPSPPLIKGGMGGSAQAKWGRATPPLAKGGVGGSVQVKIIDFGVAKATQHRLTERTVFTEQGQLVGTPGYMSPEQAEMTALDIDTRTDIYSLGVLLYELLVGARPFDDEVLRQAAFGEIQRIIREVDPPKPSTKLSSLKSQPRPLAEPRPLGSGPPSTAERQGPLPHGRGSDYGRGSIHEIAHLRHTEPATLIHQIRGDLDWIVMKCLEKDRTRRYDTANGLAMDIARYLCHEPVLAGPPSAAYKLRKFVRRNRAAVLVSTLFFAVLAAAAVGMTGLYLRAENQRRQAEQARAAEAEQRQIAQTNEQHAKDEASRAERETENALKQREKAEKFAEFMVQTLEGVGPSVAVGRDTKMLKELMDTAARRIEEGELGAVPEAEVKLRLTIGNIYRQIADFDAAERMLNPAIELAQQVYGRESAEHATGIASHALWLGSLGRWSEALPEHEKALAMRQRLFPGDHPNVANNLDDVAYSLQNLGRSAEALPHYEKALAMRQRLFPGDHPDVAMGVNNVAVGLYSLGRSAEALPKFEEALAMRQRLFPGGHPDIAESLLNVAYCLNSLGRSAEALPKYEAALAMDQRLFPGDHPDVAMDLNHVAACLRSLGRFAEALPKQEEALAMRQRLFRGDHPHVAMGLTEVAYGLDLLGRSTEALPKFEDALAMYQRLFPGDHPDVAIGLNNVASCLDSLGRSPEALPKLERALAMHQRFFPGDHPNVAIDLNNLAFCLVSLGRSAEALPKYEEALAMFQRLFPGDHPRVATNLNNLAGCLDSLGRSGEALPKFEEALAMLQRTMPADHWYLRVVEMGLGKVLSQMGRYAEAEALLVPAWEAVKDKPEVPEGRKKACLSTLVKLYEAMDAAEPGKGYNEKAAEYRALLEAREAQREAGAPAP